MISQATGTKGLPHTPHKSLVLISSDLQIDTAHKAQHRKVRLSMFDETEANSPFHHILGHVMQ